MPPSPFERPMTSAAREEVSRVPRPPLRQSYCGAGEGGGGARYRDGRKARSNMRMVANRRTAVRCCEREKIGDSE